MKRKFACVIMALVLVISLLPLGAIHTQAASNLNYSESAVSLIKQFEGFHATAYQDVNQWSVGYGTPGYSGQVITEAQADQALRTSLTSINQAINQFTANNNLYLNQSQHDALVSFSFNCGTDWMTQAGRFREAVVRNSSVNEFLFAISLWANVSSVPNAALINRRLAEANLYLNNVYSSAAPAAYTYVILDPNGGTAGNNGEDKMQAYMSGSNVNILAGNPTKSGYSFGGWFTSPTGGTGVKYLSSSTAGRTLYAQYGVPVSVTSNYCYVRGGAGSNYTQINTVSAGTSLVIVETAQVNGTAWGRYIDGWVELSNTNYVGGGSINNGNNNNNGSGTTPVNTGTVVCTTGVNIRSGPGTNYNKVGAAYNGQRISIYETVNSGGSFWGRIGQGQWISLTYVKLDSANTGNTGNTGNGGVIWEGTGGNNNTNATYQVGTVTASGLNVRSAPGLGSSIVGSYRKGDQVKIYSQTTVNNVLWGMTDKGWVSMNYISLLSNGGNSGNNGNGNGTVIATGVVKANTNLNVRNGAGIGYTKVGALSGGSVVNIYERVTVGGVEWGRIGTNQWVSLAYVTLNTNNGGSVITPTTGLGTVISSTGLNVRSGAGQNYTRVGSLTPGTQVNIYEVTTVGTQQWGRIGTNQWVCMTYIRMNGSSSGGSTTIPSTGYTGRVVNCTQLNVRAAAGTANAIVGRLTPGTTVTVYELTNVNGVSWGRISTGWVCMQYIQLTSTGSGSNSGVIWQ